MSNLHKRIKAHENMSLAEKEACKCEMCKGLNVDRDRRRNVPEQSKINFGHLHE